MDIETTFLQPPGSLLVITGPRDAGKTSFCRELAETWQAEGLITSGILSPGRFYAGKKTGYFALDLFSGESHLLASLIDGELKGFRFDPWNFDQRIFDWGNGQLRKSEHPDLLVIDELGPLEFQLQKGWTAAFDLLSQKNFRLAVVVIRPECLDDFSKMGFAYAVSEIPNQPTP
jgi:nucleoside-triphosphatase THEP1